MDKSPYLTEDGAKWLVAKAPKAIGFDFFEEYSARLKDFKPDDFVVHKIILGEGIAIIEHLTNLSKISKERVKLYFNFCEKQELIENFAQLAEYTNTEVEIISDETEEGQMLKNSFGGIAAILRFKMQE